MLFACKKETANNTDFVNNKPPIEVKKSIRISIGDFIQNQENLKAVKRKKTNPQTNRNAEYAALSDVYYVAYTSDGTRINFIHQDTINNSNNFGTISDSLAPGSYTIVLIASEKPLYTQTISSTLSPNVSSHSFGPSMIGGIGIDPLGDLFYKKV